MFGCDWGVHFVSVLFYFKSGGLKPKKLVIFTVICCCSFLLSFRHIKKISHKITKVNKNDNYINETRMPYFHCGLFKKKNERKKG